MPPRRSQKKDRFVVVFVLALAFLSHTCLLSHASQRDQSAASLPKKCDPFLVSFSFLAFNRFWCSYSRKRSASTQSPSPDGNHVALSDAVLSKRIKTVAVGSPEIDALPSDDVSYVVIFFLFCQWLIVSSASKKGQPTKLLTLKVNLLMRGLPENACTSIFCLIFKTSTESISSRRPTEKVSYIGGVEETNTGRRQVALLSKLHLQILNLYRVGRALLRAEVPRPSRLRPLLSL